MTPVQGTQEAQRRSASPQGQRRVTINETPLRIPEPGQEVEAPGPRAGALKVRLEEEPKKGQGRKGNYRGHWDRRQKQEGPRKEGAAQSYPSGWSYEQESLETVDVAENGQSLLDAMKGWLRSEECGGLTVSQNGALVALATFRSGTPLGQYLERLVKPGSDVGTEGTRQRSLLPLPLLPDSATVLSKVFETGEFKRLAGTWGAKKLNKEKAGKEMRRVGLLIWHGLVVTLLKLSVERSRSKGPGSSGSAEQGTENGQ